MGGLRRLPTMLDEVLDAGPAEAVTGRRVLHGAIRGGGPAVRLVVLTSGFPRRSETFALNELLALDAAGCLEAVFATKEGEPGPAQPGVERLLPKVHVLAPRAAPRSRPTRSSRRLGGARVTGVHGYFAHLPGRRRRARRAPARRPATASASTPSTRAASAPRAWPSAVARPRA